MPEERGILLACVSKNDEATVRELWKYRDHYPREPLLTPDDFVTWRVNWNDKVENIRSIADELGLALETFLFIDDNPVERDASARGCPRSRSGARILSACAAGCLAIPGCNAAHHRRNPPSAPNSQGPTWAPGGARRKSQRGEFPRLSWRSKSGSRRLARGATLTRVAELFQRTTQFNTTGAQFSVAELEMLLARSGGAQVFTAHVKDRFGDHGLVGAAVIKGGEIIGLVLSCRVLGLGVEHEFMRHIVRDARAANCSGRIIETARNIPVRNIYRDNGFVLEDGVWRRAPERSLAAK